MGKQLAMSARGQGRRAVVRDAALAGGLLVACVLVNDPYSVVAVTAGGPIGGTVQDPFGAWLWWAATAAMTAAVALRGRRPLPLLAVAALCAATHVALGVPPMVIDAGVLVLLYSVAASCERAVSLSTLVVLMVLVAGWSTYCAYHGRLVPGLPNAVVQVVHRPGEPGPGEVSALRRDPSASAWNTVCVYGLALLATWSTGHGARNRRAYQEQLRARAQDLERERDRQTALAAAAERARISREMHDVVAHGLSVIVIQAQGAAAALHDEPAAAEGALDAIVTVGRDSLADMRRVLAAVGETTGDAWHPPPGLAQLRTLLARLEQAGTPVRLRVEGAPVELPASVDLSAYRIIQESLTNTIKHAGPGAGAEVVLAYAANGLSVEIRDDGHRERHRGRPSVPASGGNGLRGMRERTRLLGGRFSAAHGPDGGFVVRATLPLHRTDHPDLEGHL
jgi:signal transduction histidine kinase